MYIRGRSDKIMCYSSTPTPELKPSILIENTYILIEVEKHAKRLLFTKSMISTPQVTSYHATVRFVSLIFL